MTHNDISPMSYLGSMLGNALYSGVDFSIVFEAVSVAYNEKTEQKQPDIASEIGKFERVDAIISSAIQAKDTLDGLVKEHGNTR